MLNLSFIDGKLLSLEEVWMRVPTYYKDRQHDERWSFLTQQVEFSVHYNFQFDNRNCSQIFMKENWFLLFTVFDRVICP